MQPLTLVNCSYPECSNVFYITVEQKRELKTFHYLKYGKTADVYCSKECQEKHLKDLSQAEFLRKGTLKNREYALIVHDADVTKRLKEKEVHIISGTVTEQRARCLYEKLNSVLPRKKEKFLTSHEVQMFLLNELTDDLKAPPSAAKVAAYDTMNKTRELFPNHISICMMNRKTRKILLIN